MGVAIVANGLEPLQKIEDIGFSGIGYGLADRNVHRCACRSCRLFYVLHDRSTFEWNLEKGYSEIPAASWR